MQPYHEKQFSYWILLTLPLALATEVAGLWMILNDMVPWAGALMLVLGLIIFATCIVFRHLEVTIDENGIRAKWGLFFSKSFAPVEIDKVEVRDYVWLDWNGWGIRYNRHGEWAYSQTGVGMALKIYPVHGKPFWITVKHPDKARKLLDQVVESRGLKPKPSRSARTLPKVAG